MNRWMLLLCLGLLIGTGGTARAGDTPEALAEAARKDLDKELRDALQDKEKAQDYLSKSRTRLDADLVKDLTKIRKKLSPKKAADDIALVDKAIKGELPLKDLNTGDRNVQKAVDGYLKDLQELAEKHEKKMAKVTEDLTAAQQQYEKAMEKAVAAADGSEDAVGKLKAAQDEAAQEIRLALADTTGFEPGAMVKVTAENGAKAYPYWLYVPKDYDFGGGKRDQYPLVLFLHGMGERGFDLDVVTKNGPPKHVKAGEHFPFILVSPQCPKDAQNKGWWDNRKLEELLDEVQGRLRVDPDRVYCTGLSMGGIGTYALAMHAPTRFAAIAPVAASGNVGQVAKIAHLPVWAFHGDKDTVVHFDKGKEMADALKRADADVTFTVYPGVGHDSWTQAYKTAELYTWLLSHKRKK